MHYCVALGDSHWKDNDVLQAGKHLCMNLLGFGKVGSADSCSSGSLVLRNLYVTMLTFRYRRLSLGSIRRIRPTIDVLSVWMSYSRLERSVGLLLSLFALEQFE